MYICVIKNNKEMTANQIKAMTKEELGIFLSPLTELASQMIIAGTLRKNVVRHFTNKGFTLDAAENLTEVGVFKAQELLKNKPQ